MDLTIVTQGCYNGRQTAPHNLGVGVVGDTLVVSTTEDVSWGLNGIVWACQRMSWWTRSLPQRHGQYRRTLECKCFSREKETEGKFIHNWLGSHICHRGEQQHAGKCLTAGSLRQGNKTKPNQTQICNICWFPRCKYSHLSQFQTSNLMSLSLDLGRNEHNQLLSQYQTILSYHWGRLSEHKVRCYRKKKKGS